MKRLLLPLLLVILTFTVVSCYNKRTHAKAAELESPDTVPYVCTKQWRPSVDQYTYGQIGNIKHFDYNGHSYIQFHISGKHEGGSGVVHDPDCKCNQKDTLK